MSPEAECASTIGELVAALDRRFPLAWADPWDRVGLIVGPSGDAIRGVLVTLDATGAAVRRAAAAGANVLVTHHPPYLDPPASPQCSDGPRGTLEAALRLGIAVVSLHTCLDRSPEGADALAGVLGLTPVEPLEAGVEEVSIVTAFVPGEDVSGVREAMGAAGAGRIGPYEGCAFAAEGSGYFAPLPSALPTVAPSPESVRETRLEMVCPRGAAGRVVEAARAAHPYEEPLIVAVDAVRARGIARYGRICTWSRAGTVAELAADVAEALGTAVRIWGDPRKPVRRVGIANGSGSSLVARALDRVDVLVTGEVRYHDALDATADGLAIIEAGHDCTEWPLVSVLAAAVGEAVGPDVRVRQEPPVFAWMTVEGVHDGS